MKTKLKTNTYGIVMRAVEEGIRDGLRRADKHADDPLTERQRERAIYELETALANSLCDVVDFD
jgi:hypothetical protein